MEKEIDHPEAKECLEKDGRRYGIRYEKGEIYCGASLKRTDNPQPYFPCPHQSNHLTAFVDELTGIEMVVRKCMIEKEN